MTGRHSQPDDPYGRQSGPAPRGHEDLPTAGRRPGPAPGPGPRPAPEPQPPAQRYHEVPPEWDTDENTHMISKLGYVPRESRGGSSPEYFDTETVTAADRSKFRARKRAKKSSPLMKILIGVVALLLLGGIGFGVWYLAGTGGDDEGDGLTYAALEKPCDALDASPMEPLTDGAKLDTTRDEVVKNAHSSEQYCDANFGKAGEVVQLFVYTKVFTRDAGAENEFEDAMKLAKTNAEEAKENGGAEQIVKAVEGVGSKAYSLHRVAAKGSETVDYLLAYYEDNAYIETRISVFNGAASEKKVKGYTEEVARKYMENWAAA